MIEQHKKALKEINDNIEALNEDRLACEQVIADLSCPFNVGDRIISRGGEKAEVFKIYYYSPWMDEKISHKIDIKKIKNNGELYQHPSTPWQDEEWRLDE